ncbi:MAG TPA: DUF1697 domain-containing protein [Longilinea sp.]|nr:DUF1697 domain-containing protein [Longilinea sp.]
MQTFIALFRGINVGGNSLLPMSGLKAVLEGLGAQNVCTYIQSGNAVFQSEAEDPAQLSRQLSAEIHKQYGFEAWVLLLGIEAVIKAMESNPFPAAEADPSHLHVGFLAGTPPAPDLAKLDRLKIPSEQYQLIDDVFYLYAPDGVGRSKLAAGAEKILGVAMTDRNWRTVSKIREMAEE